MSELERCWPWLAAALIHGGNTHNKEHLIDLIKKKEVNFWPLPRGAFVTYFLNHPSGLREFRFWLAGGELSEIVKGERLLSEWARTERCDCSTIVGRRGWLKALPGYRETATVMVKDLK